MNENICDKIHADNKGVWLCIVNKRWKHKVLKYYLRGANKITFKKKLPKINRIYKDIDYILVWGRQTIVPSNIQAQNPQIKVITAEDGFLSGLGLGIEGNFYHSLLFDDRGIHYDASTTSKINELLNYHIFEKEEIKMGETIINLIRKNNLSKCIERRIIEVKLPQLAVNKKTILVIGQLEYDKSVIYSLSDIKTNESLLEVVREKNKNAWIIFKPHPNELITGLYNKKKVISCLKHCDQIALEGDINEWLKVVGEVHVISSTAGLEALIQEKKVYTYGTPCYAGWGLTIDYAKQLNRKRNLSLEELITITYGLYPRYFDWTRDSFGTAVESIKQLIEVKEGRKKQFKDKSASRMQKRIKMWRGGRILLIRPIKNWRIRELKHHIYETKNIQIKQ